MDSFHTTAQSQLGADETAAAEMAVMQELQQLKDENPAEFVKLMESFQSLTMAAQQHEGNSSAPPIPSPQLSLNEMAEQITKMRQLAADGNLDPSILGKDGLKLGNDPQQVFIIVELL